MFPGMNPGQIKQAMKQLGIKQEDLPATEVIIKLENKEIILKNPSVQRINMQGQINYQVTGDEEEQEINNTPDISEEDIATVMQQTNCSKEEAKAAIEICEGDLAEAIINLTENL